MARSNFASKVALWLAFVPAGSAARDVPDMLLEATDAEVGIEVDGTFRGRWQLDLNNYPRDLPLPVNRSESTTICFTNGGRRACAYFVPNQTRSLQITVPGGVIATTVRAQWDKPPAVFDPVYQATHRGHTTVEVPEVYELVNVAVAITPFGRADRDLVYHDSDYFRAVQAHFANYADHPLIRRVDTMLREDRSSYFPFKMNGYAFVFDEKGSIVRSPIYDRTGFAGSYDNAVLPYLQDLQDFARVSEFRNFYDRNRDVYADQIQFFEEEAQVSRISTWLSERFPSVKPYDGVRIVFSPLVAYNQSLTTIEADGYRELQPHVNYPYKATRGLTESGAAVERSAILFTEMNHGYINPTSERYRQRIQGVLTDRMRWADDNKAARNYLSAQALFDEYMNWALVSLFYRDLMTVEDFAIAHDAMVENLQDGRGFKRFAAFDAELLRLYMQRTPGETLEDLYPAIIGWFEAQ